MRVAPHSSVDKLFYQIWHSGRLGPQERLGLMNALLEEITSQEQAAVNRILHAVRRGWIEVA